MLHSSAREFPPNAFSMRASARSARIQHAFSTQSARVHHAFSTQSARVQHAFSTHAARVQR
eukprot:11214503-Lingulodinium_polyedra.AAC.1